MLAPPMADFGGIQRYTTILVRALQDVLGGESVRCLAMSEVRNAAEQGRLSTRSKLDFACRALGEAVRWRPDLVICAHLALGPVGWFVSKFAHRRNWIFVYGIEAWTSLSFLKRTALRRADRVIGISRFTCDEVVKRQRVKGERIEILPCALEEGLSTIKPARVGPHQSLGAGQRVILTVARMAAAEQYKGHDVMLRALPSVLARIPNLMYVVVGDGDDRSRIEALADNLGLRPHFLFTGRVSDAELAALYQRSDVFALPARTVLTGSEVKGEGFGIVFLEAMAFGKPVIGPREGAPAEIIHHGVHGLLVNPEDPEAVAEALVELLTNPDKARDMGQAASVWAREQYSYGAFREKLKRILAE